MKDEQKKLASRLPEVDKDAVSILEQKGLIRGYPDVPLKQSEEIYLDGLVKWIATALASARAEVNDYRNKYFYALEELDHFYKTVAPGYHPKGLKEITQHIEFRDKKIKELEAKLASQPSALPEATMGVGDGTGQLFVHGSYESIKTLQAKIFELEELRRRPDASGLSELIELIKDINDWRPGYGSNFDYLFGPRLMDALTQFKGQTAQSQLAQGGKVEPKDSDKDRCIRILEAMSRWMSKNLKDKHTDESWALVRRAKEALDKLQPHAGPS